MDYEGKPQVRSNVKELVRGALSHAKWLRSTDFESTMAAEHTRAMISSAIVRKSSANAMFSKYVEDRRANSSSPSQFARQTGSLRQATGPPRSGAGVGVGMLRGNA